MARRSAITQRNTVIRAMHDLGAPTDRPRIAANGWARWAPDNAAAIGAHLVGGAGLVLATKGRLGLQH